MTFQLKLVSKTSRNNSLCATPPPSGNRKSPVLFPQHRQQRRHRRRAPLPPRCHRFHRQENERVLCPSRKNDIMRKTTKEDIETAKKLGQTYVQVVQSPRRRFYTLIRDFTEEDYETAICLRRRGKNRVRGNKQMTFLAIYLMMVPTPALRQDLSRKKAGQRPRPARGS